MSLLRFLSHTGHEQMMLALAGEFITTNLNIRKLNIKGINILIDSTFLIDKNPKFIESIAAKSVK